MKALPLLLCLLAASPARAWWWGAKASSAWAAQPVVLDADEKEWDAHGLDDAEGLTYGFANDSQYLYVLLVPHTKSAKAQFSGTYHQSFTLWLDARAGMRKSAGFALASPGAGTQIPLQPVGAAVSSATLAAAALSAPDRRSVLEARLPLSALGEKLPSTISVGFEASAPDRWPKNARRADGRPMPEEDEFAPIKLWVRVTLARPPQTTR